MIKALPLESWFYSLFDLHGTKLKAEKAAKQNIQQNFSSGKWEVDDEDLDIGDLDSDDNIMLSDDKDSFSIQEDWVMTLQNIQPIDRAKINKEDNFRGTRLEVRLS